MDFYIGQIFTEMYPPEAAEWCNNKGDCHIEEIDKEGDARRFQIVENRALTEEEVKAMRIAMLEAFLASTDWYAIRFADTGEPIPQEVKDKRQSAREEISELRK